MNRTYYYVESTGNTTANDGGVDKINFSDTATDGDVWFQFATCSVNQAAANTWQILFYMADGGILDHHVSPKDVADYFSCPFLGVDTATSSTMGCVLQLLNDTTGGLNVYNIREASALMLKKHPLDEYAGGSNATASTTNTAYEVIQTLTFTPPTAGDYLIAGFVSGTKDTSASSYNVKMVIDGTDYSDATFRTPASGYYLPFFDHDVVNLSASSKTITLQAKVTTSGTATFYFPTIVALRLDTFPWYSSSSSRSEATSTSSTYQTPINPSVRLSNQPIWMLSSCLGRRGSATTSHKQRTLYDSTTIQETSNEPAVASAEHCHMAQSVFTPSTVDHTASGQYCTDGAGITVAGKSESVITWVQLEDDATVWIKGATIPGATIL